MDVIGKQTVWSFGSCSEKPEAFKNPAIRRGGGHQVNDYMDLARKVAHLQFLNRDFVLLFRGQSDDYLSARGSSMLKPRLFRKLGRGNKKRPDLEKRYRRLQLAERDIASVFDQEKLEGRNRLKRQRIVRWSILQHYEVCCTPLLDVTHSLRIAASFASEKTTKRAFLYVLAVPNLSGAITASAESNLQIVRLSSICPASALRPHIQEGYLLGEYPELNDYEQQKHYEIYETDFGRRLLAKFWFDPATFWDEDDVFPRVKAAALYPNAQDPIYSLTSHIKEKLDSKN